MRTRQLGRPGRSTNTDYLYDPRASQRLARIIRANPPAPLNHSVDACPNCGRTGARRWKNPDGTCRSRAACEREQDAVQSLNEEGVPMPQSVGIGARSPHGEMIMKLMHDEGVSEDTARKRIRAQMARDIAKANPVPANQKAKLLTNLFLHGKAQTVRDLRLRLQRDNFVIDPHALTHVLWSMQKDQHLTFRERPTGSTSNESALSSIRLTKGGITAARAFAQNGVAAKGDAILADIKDTKPTQLIDYKPQIKRDIEREVVDAVVAELHEAVTPAPSPVKESPDEPITFFVEYPLIGKLLNRQARLESAAQTLEEEGEPDLAISVLEKVSYTPFEQEVLRLAKRYQ